MISSGWKKTWSRLAAMSWDEFQTRAAQEAAKHLDLQRYRLGLGPGTNGVRADAGPPGKFFFSPDDLPGRTKILRERLPRAVEEIIREADDVCDHRFRLLGYTGLDYSREIDWHLDAVSGKRAPLEPWFKIRFLDFDHVGDHKVTWELNRHQHLVTLAKAWQVTGDSRYATEIASQWTSWQRTNPYPLGINWASSLEVAFRSLSWLWVRELLAGCDAIPSVLSQRLVEGLALNGRHIERYLSTYFSPNTHLIGEAVALFFIGTLCPGLFAARGWQRRGWHILLAEAARQVRLDGVYFEQSLYYLVYALDFFLHARQLAVCNGIEVPASFDQTLVKMLEVLQALSQGGTAEGFGDDDGGRVFNPRRNRTEHMQDPLALGAGIFGGFTNPGLTEEAVWLLGLEDISGGPHCPPPHIGSKAFDAGGIYVMSSADTLRQCLMMDAGPQGTGRSGHGHADALSVRLTFGGQRWLVDSGTFTYRSNDNERDHFRGTGAHNTLRLDGEDQAVAQGPFAWNSIPTVISERWLQGVTFTLFTGSHTGYKRLEDPVRHRRFVLHLHSGIDGRHGLWVVRDVAEGHGVHMLEIFWHFAPDLVVIEEGSGFVAKPDGKGTTDSGTVPMGLYLLPASSAGWVHEVTSAHVSPVYGVKEQAPLMRSSTRLELPAECATLLLPQTGSSSGCGKFTKVSAGGGEGQPTVNVYSYAAPEGTHRFFFPATGGKWSFGPCSSDGGLLYCYLEGRRLAHMVFCAGSFVSFRGKPVVIHNRAMERFEYVRRDGAGRTFPSDLAVLDELAAEAIDFD
ncbi:MAG TPA: alginate lyase family protein [Terriglobia bacterium]|nr:alginate lyase family protein [Terriglobia bacterium]